MQTLPNIDNKNLEANEKIRNWFDSLVGNLLADQLSIETNTASEEKNSLYNVLINGEEFEVQNMVRVASSMHFIKHLILDYLNELKNKNKKPLKLALDFSDAKVLVWAEIKDNDEETEDALILAEAKVNAKYSDYGFHLTSTIVEKCDKLKVPPHYKKLINN